MMCIYSRLNVTYLTNITFWFQVENVDPQTRQFNILTDSQNSKKLRQADNIIFLSCKFTEVLETIFFSGECRGLSFKIFIILYKYSASVRVLSVYRGALTLQDSYQGVPCCFSTIQITNIPDQ